MSISLQKPFKNLIAFCFLVTFCASVFAEQGLFWKAESPASKDIYLFGTMHTDDNRITDFSPTVINAIKSVDAFMMETLSPNDPSVFMMPDGDLTTLLTEKELDQVYALAEFHVMHREAATHMKPWLLAVVFDSPKPLTPFAQDNLLMTKAEESAKEVIGIEDTKEHFGLMDDFSRDEQLTMLRAVLKRTPAQKERDFELLINAYLAGDSNKVAALDEKITGGMLPPALWQKMRVSLLDKRNIVMAERIVDEAKNKKVFVAVGASHLAGDGGLIARLKAAGYTLSPVAK
ncbi:MAG: TraB/GumN family protein [Methylotenera sp.]|uniref:TraB/GumN family protein n=1 Tax=Methylotenera sp. TaxID=2051956 RepID=UPI00271E905D|nr:TraB/GumN family protein [Methylotenera sp.]MDO9204031.1 TraB/GumN family protein [Methylotenera sp.]MDO9394254.1 TraB/GumN family protein [Methylotenera sp.]MDP1523081.1 TraB/GumN family protein [Methylotenera sp.]MDP3818640.1 TraB/GumN family protein [Methylotenera sp.]MDZ4211129.1 TraB/GumN family protein [Methylotenera sp.]